MFKKGLETGGREIECVYVLSKAKEELSKGQPSLTIMALYLPVVSNFGEKIDYLFSRCIYFTTKFIINFRLLSEFLYQSEPVKEYSSQQLVFYFTLTNRIYFVFRFLALPHSQLSLNQRVG